MGAVTRAFIRNRARLYADGRPGGANAFVKDSDPTPDAASFDTLVNGAIAELYDLLVSLRGHEYYASDATLAIVAGTSQYPLPADFYQLLSVRLEWAAQDFEELKPMGVRERTRYENIATWNRGTAKAYRLRGTFTASARIIELLPVPSSSVTGRLRYIPICPLLVDDTTTFDDVNDWSKLVALKAAIEYRTIAEKPIGNLQQLYNECAARISALGDQRNANYAEQVQQVYPEGRRRALGYWDASGSSGGGGEGDDGGIFDGSFDGSFE
jgi:hypothetical protein